jgi:uncharacterized protein
MFIYAASKAQFIDDVNSNTIDEKLINSFKNKFGYRSSPSEVNAWKHSLLYMNNVLAMSKIPNEASVAIEYRIPNTSKRIDFILAGRNEHQQDSLIIVELKQWSEVESTKKDGVVKTFIGGNTRETTHPSYQAWTYASCLQNFNSVVQENQINVMSCAYLHNCMNGEALMSAHYQEHLSRAPIFLRNDVTKLKIFLENNIRHVGNKDLLYEIEQGKVRPSKQLAAALSSMLKGNQEFLMIDDQKVAFETALELARKSSDTKKRVLIVEGGPGSGKSVLAINLLVRYNELGMTSQYVTKNAAPRAVYEKKLTGSFRKSAISTLFVGSGGFSNTDPNTFDALIIDEAHRLNEKSGLYSNIGENQIKEMIASSRCSVFFIDENQKVTFKDIGTKDEIRKWAKFHNCQIQELELSSQFRCNGQDGYLAWIDNTLQIKPTANENLKGIDYQFEVFETPEKLRDHIFDLNRENNNARLVAGYCWEWKSKKDPNAYDIQIGKNFKMKWNLASHGASWVIHPDSVTEVGCIHTCQGLELEYIGVILGNDLIVRDGKVITNALSRAKGDKSITGFKSLLKTNPAQALSQADIIIKNTYRTLMTRGIKGCFIYSTDEETREFFKSKLYQGA